jgi:hypothetical protein
MTGKLACTTPSINTPIVRKSLSQGRYIDDNPCLRGIISAQGRTCDVHFEYVADLCER